MRFLLATEPAVKFPFATEPAVKFFMGNGAWVPHISLVFREMWDSTALDLEL
jgi:hypothetical protein